jgi:hypothetical protein
MDIFHTGRVLHHFRIHTDDRQQPTSAECDCGACWDCQYPGQGVCTWGMTHAAPADHILAYRNVVR